MHKKKSSVRKRNVGEPPREPVSFGPPTFKTQGLPLSLDLPCVLLEKNVFDYNAEILAHREI
jgi:hypothetical protein